VVIVVYILELLMGSMEVDRAITDEKLKCAFDFYDEVIVDSLVE
jgi:hypothetical protein